MPQHLPTSADPAALSASAHYGLVHLLRLFVRLGSYMNVTSWTPATVAQAQAAAQHLLDYLAANLSKYHADGDADYEPTSVAYQKRVYET